MAVLGGTLKRKEKLSGRLADVLSQLYLSSAVLKRFEDQGRPVEDLPLVQWWCEHSLRCMQQSLDTFLLNFPNRLVARLLRAVIFPLGKGCRGPSDRLGHDVTGILLSPSAARDRLTAGMFLPPDKAQDEPLTRLEQALLAVIAAEPAEKKLRKAFKAKPANMQNREQQIAKAVEDQQISQSEADTILRADALRYAAVSVDHFDPAELGKGQLPIAPSNQECA
jgi:acyl-CoA dehydrogenase